jgi:hypothetical protein
MNKSLMLVNQINKCFLFLVGQLKDVSDKSKVGKENYNLKEEVTRTVKVDANNFSFALQKDMM